MPWQGSAERMQQMAEDEVERRISCLTELAHSLETFSPDSTREEFAATFASAVAMLELTELGLARQFMVSRPTIGRWMRAESAPHPLGRKPVMNGLRKIAKERIVVLRRMPTLA